MLVASIAAVALYSPEIIRFSRRRFLGQTAATAASVNKDDLPTDAKIQEWLQFVEEYDLNWHAGHLNIIYEPEWVSMRPFLSDDTIEASNQRLLIGDILNSALFMQGDRRSIIKDNHLKSLLRRDLTALLLKLEATRFLDRIDDE